MGKRDGGKFEKKPRDYYPTRDPASVLALKPFVDGKKFVEPCCGDGSLARLLELHTSATFWFGSDIEPQMEGAFRIDATELTYEQVCHADLLISNPPFTWNLLEPLIKHLPTLLPTWLLLPADIMHNRRMAPYMNSCQKVVSVGRLWWLDNKIKGVDNFCWYLWDYNNEFDYTQFYGRT